jgi:hypothetical protein
VVRRVRLQAESSDSTRDATTDSTSGLGCFVYPFFLLHMGVFGVVGFTLMYSGISPEVTIGQGLIAIPIYLIFYLFIFGRDEIMWMFINAGIGIFGIASQLEFILGLFGKHVADFPPAAHIIPGMYWIMYTFLIRHLVLDIFHAHDDEAKRTKVHLGYVIGSFAVYGGLHLLGL